MPANKGGGDIRRLRDFASHIVEKLENASTGEHKVWFSDETYFLLNVCSNKQNWQHWCTENPHLSVVSQLHPKRVTVWCSISSKKITGPIFIDSMVTEVKYRELLEQHYDYEDGRLNMTNQYFYMQDGPHFHRTVDVFTWLETAFGEHLIVLYAENFKGNWNRMAPYSQDLNPCYFFLWGLHQGYLYIYISFVRVYVTELNGWTDFDEIFCVCLGGFENGLDVRFGPI